MKNSKRFSILSILMMLAMVSAFAQKPRVHILATGGTIAGTGASATQTNYTAGQVAIGTLLSAVPEIKNIAEVTGEQIVKIGSQDMNDIVWLTLAKRINEIFEKNEADAVVITHGTDTMEETAYFLQLTVKSKKPVILVGAMRPSTALSADGPLNLYNAVVAAAAPESVGKGVIVAMNNYLVSASDVTKSNTVQPETFIGANSGPLGYVLNGKVFYNHLVNRKHTVDSEFDVRNLKELPKVGIVYSYSNVGPEATQALIKSGYKGIIHAGVGNGNIHKDVFPVLADARKKNILVVRSSRVPFGPTTLDAEVDDAKYEFIASQNLNPQKARVLLMLGLTKTTDWKKLQEYFNQY
ncbi:L-asparaginase 2 [Porphyromonas pogonae]|uniref:L-asparaginase 2 n=1 Tax=Porphyromonas pogonae TaxID=867595 RepID=UPI002E760A9F|nr:L-asparaginase 2 [Porphyromonas pogonae]